MINGVLVFLGGGIGSVCRYLLSQQWNVSNQNATLLPYGTLIANILSCLILGILVQKQLTSQLSENSRLFLAIGFCGGFSTFSSFSYEIYYYIQKNQFWQGFAYTCLSLVLGVLALRLGLKVSQMLF